MKPLGRIWAVTLGYLAASTVGALGVQASIRLGIGGDAISAGLDVPPSYLAIIIMNLVFRAGLITAPVALPIIGYAEWKHISSFRYFAGAGLVLSLAISAIFVGWLYDARVWLFVLIVFATPLLSAIVFWFVAWRIFAPTKVRDDAP